MSADEPADGGPVAPPNDRLAEVLRLTTALSEQALDAQIMKRPLPDDQVRALANAALLLQEHAIPLPPLLTQVLHEIGADGLTKAAGGSDQPTPSEQAHDGEKARSLAWLLRPFQGRT